MSLQFVCYEKKQVLPKTQCGTGNFLPFSVCVFALFYEMATNLSGPIYLLG